MSKKARPGVTGALTIVVPGRPAPKGSWRNVGRGRMIPDNPRARPWQDLVRMKAREAWNGPVLSCPVSVRMRFAFTGAKGREFPTTRRSSGDLDKLERAVLDALTGVVYADDSQVVHIESWKVFAENDFATITIWKGGRDGMP